MLEFKKKRDLVSIYDSRSVVGYIRCRGGAAADLYDVRSGRRKRCWFQLRRQSRHKHRGVLDTLLGQSKLRTTFGGRVEDT